jgi:hypothetical protein
MYEDFLHGIEVIDIEGGPRPIETARSSVIGIVGTAPDADPSVFPLNTPVLMAGRETLKLAKLGARGTLPWSLEGIYDQFGPMVVVIRVHRAPSPRTTVYRSLTRPIVPILGEEVTRGAGETDALENVELVSIGRVYIGSTAYLRATDWEREGDVIRWKRYTITETVARRASTTDPLDHQDHLLAVTKVYQGATEFEEGVDYQLHPTTNGIQWLPNGQQPEERTDYFVLYSYGRRPALNAVYEVDYNYYDNAHVIDEDVIRDAEETGTDFDPLANYDIISVESLKQGVKTWVQGTDWEVLNDKIHWKSNSIVESVTRADDVIGTPEYNQLNVGNGTIGTITPSASSRIGTYTLTCTNDTTAGSEVWSVVAPGGANLGNATTAVAYTSDQINFTIAAGGINWQIGDIITIPVTAVTDSLANSAILLSIPENGVFQGATIYTQDVDWELTNDNKISWLTNNKPASDSTYSVNYVYGDRPGRSTTYEVTYNHKIGELVAMSNVIGGVNIDSGAYEGIHAFKSSESELKLKPKILIAPGFSNHTQVTVEMLAVAESLKAIVIADGPNANDETVVNWRYQFDSKRLYIVDPWAKVWNTHFSDVDYEPFSPRAAALFSKRDNEKGVWWSPSNQVIQSVLGNSRPVHFAIDDPNSRSNYLNSHDITTVINESGGYKLWGNHTCSSDERYRFISAVRTNDMIAESLLKGLLWAVDRNIGRAFFSEVSETVNAYLRRLASQGAIILGRDAPCYVNQEDNPPDGLALGKARFKFEYANVIPAEHISLDRIIKQEYLSEVFREADFTRG